MPNALFIAPIRITPVESGNIQGIGYDAEDQILEVQFKNATRYRYKNVPEILYQEFLDHRSPGSFLHSHIKGKFECFKWEPAQPENPEQEPASGAGIISHISEK